MAGSNEQILRN